VRHLRINGYFANDHPCQQDFLLLLHYSPICCCTAGAEFRHFAGRAGQPALPADCHIPSHCSSTEQISRPPAKPVSPASLLLYGTLLQIWRYLIDGVPLDTLPGALSRVGLPPDGKSAQKVCQSFIQLFPPRNEFAGVTPHLQRHLLLRELLMLHVSADNRAIDHSENSLMIVNWRPPPHTI